MDPKEKLKMLKGLIGGGRVENNMLLCNDGLKWFLWNFYFPGNEGSPKCTEHSGCRWQ